MRIISSQGVQRKLKLLRNYEEFFEKAQGEFGK